MAELEKAQSLARSADILASHYGHRMRPWIWQHLTEPDRTIGYTNCKDCGQWSHIDTRPDPAIGGLDISGDAVTLRCKEE